MKVYCSDCKYFEEWYYGIMKRYVNYLCLSPSNTKIKYTWKESLYVYILSPKQKNKNNDCDWYEKK